MKVNKRFFLLCIFLIPFVIFAGCDSTPVVFKSGDWAVHRSTDAMTDEISCTGIYNDNPAIQLTADALYIQVRGGVRGITLRYGDQPAEKIRQPSSMEERIGVIIVENNDFNRLFAYGRLRAEALTALDDLKNYDINLTGITAAVKNIQSGCPR